MINEAGLSDFHKMCVTVIKMIYCKQKLTLTHYRHFNPLGANITKWSNSLKQFVGNLFELFDHFVILTFKG